MPQLAAPLMGAAAGGGVMSTVGTVLSVVGLAADFIGGMQTAKAQKEQGAYQKRLMDQNAGQARAESQRVAEIEKRKGDIVASDLVARAMGSDDPTITKEYGRIKARGATNAYNALYSGESRAAGMEQQGDMAYYQGKLDSHNTKSSAYKGLIGGATSLMAKYAPGDAHGSVDDEINWWGPRYESSYGGGLGSRTQYMM